MSMVYVAMTMITFCGHITEYYVTRLVNATRKNNAVLVKMSGLLERERERERSVLALHLRIQDRGDVCRQHTYCLLYTSRCV